MTKPVLYGFDGSTYVRTVRQVLHLKGADYDQVQVNLMTGDNRTPEHMARHPFAKIPVVDVDGMRLIETQAIARYLDETLPGPSVTPKDAKDRARMTMQMCVIDAYGYPALIGAAGYHLFPDFIGNPSAEQHEQTLGQAEKVLDVLMEKKGDDPWLAGSEMSLADLHLAPILFYVSLTPDKDRLIKGKIAEWWDRMQGVEAFKATEPDLG